MTDGSPTRKVVLVTESLQLGGAERQVVNDARILTDCGWAVGLVSLAGGPLRRELPPSVELVVLAGKNPILSCMLLAGYCRRARADLIHSHQIVANLICALAGRLAHVPTLVTEHGLQIWRKSKHRLAARFTYCLADRVLCVSEATRRVRIEKDAAPACKCSVVPNCYSPELGEVGDEDNRTLRRELSIAPDSKIVGFLGRQVAVKRLDLLGEIAESVLLKHPEAIFLLVGDGPEQMRVSMDIRRRGIHNSFRFVGQQHNVARYLGIMDLLVLSSERESLSLSLIEAAAMGIPQVAFDVGGNREVIEENVTGMLIPFPDTGRFADAVAKILERDDMRKGMGVNAKRRARLLFSPEARAASLESIYQEVCGGIPCRPHADVVL